MAVADAGQRIRKELASWPGVEARPHRFGGTAFLVGRRELGHVHGDAFLDAPLPRAERDRLIAEGSAHEHHTVPDSGWVTVPFRREEDVDQALAVLRAAYERARGAAGEVP